MSEHQHHHATVARVCDVAVVGGSAAGLAAALQLGRQRRSVIVVDDGTPRNAPAAHVHGYLGHEGIAPQTLLATAREEVRSYGGEILPGHVLAVTREGGRLRVELAGGNAVLARRVLAATGLADELPDVAGLAEHWGDTVIHCPFCHGYEVRDQRIVHLVDHPLALHAAALYRRLTARLTVIAGDVVSDSSGGELSALAAAGVDVVRGRASRVLTDPTGRLTGLELDDGTQLDADAVAVGPRFHARTEAFAPLGLATDPHPTGLGDVVSVDATGATAVPGLYAAGNVTDPGQQVSAAAAQGSRVGAMIGIDLAQEELQAATRPSANQADWDHRYSGEALWSGNPNGTLVAEARDLPAARALDVGAGEGGDAMWLAEQGWHVTATDVSHRVLGRLAAQAEARGVAVEALHADANGHRPFTPGGYELVSAQYASIPRTPDHRAEHNLLEAVAPGGLLIVVGHDLAPLRAAIDPQRDSRAFDPDAYTRVDDVAAVLAGLPDWEIELHEKRPRPAGAASSHHVDDVVLRARRRA